jgi:hypothetical protein
MTHRYSDHASPRLGSPCVLCKRRHEDDIPCTNCIDCNAPVCRDCSEPDLLDWLCPACTAERAS